MVVETKTPLYVSLSPFALKLQMALLDLYSCLLYLGVSLIFLIFLAWLIITVYLYRTHKKYSYLPCPKYSSFYLGHLLSYIAVTRSPTELAAQLYLDWGRECGPLYVVFLLHIPCVVCLKPQNVMEVLSSSKMIKADWFYGRMAHPFGVRLFGQGLGMIVYEDIWKRRRSLYESSFKQEYLTQLVPMFNECADVFVKRLSALADGKTEVLLRDKIAMETLNAIAKVGYNMDLHQTYSDEQLGLRHLHGDGTLRFIVTQSLEAVHNSFFKPYMRILNPSKVKGYREAIRALRKIGRELIEKRIVAVEREETLPNDILTQILTVASTQGTVNVEDLIDDFAVFFFAGQDTTASTISFALVLMLQHPDVLQRVLEEISEVLGKRKTVTAEDLEELKYLEQVLKETLRLYPLPPGTFKQSTEDVTFCGYHLPKGTTFNVMFYATQRNPDHWEDPETFDPERFHPDRSRPHPGSYHPFNIGPQSCIGKAFAMMEAKIFITRLLMSFKLRLPDNYKLKLQLKFLMSPADGVPCTLEPLP